MNTEKQPADEAKKTCLPACPFLPALELGRAMDWRVLGVFRESGDRGAAFYEAALRYGQYLWMRGRAARAILCLDRALGADLTGDEAVPVLEKWPLPYAALAWMLRNVPAGIFIGNPRVHFQHYAGRMNEPRREQRRWRAWACWAIVRVARPEFSGDPRHVVEEPSMDVICEKLRDAGIDGESEMWKQCVSVGKYN